MTTSEERQVEFLQKTAEARILTALSHFSERVADGSATPEQIAFMSKVAELVDQGRLRELKQVARKAAEKGSDRLKSEAESYVGSAVSTIPLKSGN